jgi:hypothetical protein
MFFMTIAPVEIWTGYRCGVGTAAYATSPASSSQMVIAVSEMPNVAAVVASNGMEYTQTNRWHPIKVTGARKYADASTTA